MHRSLNQIEDQTSVDLQVLLEEIVRQIVDNMAVDRAKISVTVDVLPISVTGEIAVPIALFTVEALANVFKHAFPLERPTGVVSIELGRRSDGFFSLAIADNGVGYSAADSKSGVGERLLKVFGRQVQGTVFLDSQSNLGTRVELTFAVTGQGTEIPANPVSSSATKRPTPTPSD